MKEQIDWIKNTKMDLTLAASFENEKQKKFWLVFCSCVIQQQQHFKCWHCSSAKELYLRTNNLLLLIKFNERIFTEEFQCAPSLTHKWSHIFGSSLTFRLLFLNCFRSVRPLSRFLLLLNQSIWIFLLFFEVWGRNGSKTRKMSKLAKLLAKIPPFHLLALYFSASH